MKASADRRRSRPFDRHLALLTLRNGPVHCDRGHVPATLDHASTKERRP
ncbi:hypothetical protein ATKI12_7005 [Kitasatospora sp. Ki12]